MQINSSSNPSTAYTMAMLKSANEQPELAGELISKTVSGLLQAKGTRALAQPVDNSAITGTGSLIDITA